MIATIKSRFFLYLKGKSLNMLQKSWKNKKHWSVTARAWKKLVKFQLEYNTGTVNLFICQPYQSFYCAPEAGKLLKLLVSQTEDVEVYGSSNCTFHHLKCW